MQKDRQLGRQPGDQNAGRRLNLNTTGRGGPGRVAPRCAVSRESEAESVCQWTRSRVEVWSTAFVPRVVIVQWRAPRCVSQLVVSGLAPPCGFTTTRGGVEGGASLRGTEVSRESPATAKSRTVAYIK